MSLRRSFKIVTNYILGPVLFVLIGTSIYRQVQQQPDLPLQWQAILHAITGNQIWLLVIALALVPVNWGIEALKWQKLASHVTPVSFGLALKSVVAGVSFTMLTPNRMGEYLGRALYFPEGSRIRAATLTIVSSLSQLIITFMAGLAGLIYFTYFSGVNLLQANGISTYLLNIFVFGSLLAVVLGILLYFNIGWLVRLVERIPPISKYAFFIHLIGEIHYFELLKIVLLSATRYMVFLIQYALLFSLFDVQLTLVQAFASTAVMLLMLAAVPTIALVELGIRGKVSLYVFGLFSSNSLGILVTSASIMFINIIFPAIMGSILLLSVKLFKKEKETAEQSSL